MPAYAPIRIVLQKSTMNPAEDDILKIVPHEEDGYDVIFRNNTVSVVHTRHVATDDLMDYLENFFDAIQHDVTPYEFIQVDVPSYPPILLTPDCVDEYLYVIEDQIDGMSEDWPVETLLPINPKPKSKSESKKSKKSKKSNTTNDEDEMDEIVRILLGLGEPASCSTRSCCH